MAFNLKEEANGHVACLQAAFTSNFKNLEQKWQFEKGKQIMHGYLISLGAILNENDNFKIWKRV